MTDEMIKTTIEEKLKEVEKQENVRIIAAVESGSRSWGFASPDSDYDVRFLYVRDKQSYLRLDKIRDVIEWQLDEVLDINGWDIKKALQLLYKSNPTVFEWCASPVVYRTSPEFEELKKLLPLYFSKKKGLYHYWHMAESNYRTYLHTDLVRAKKYFYVLRPLLAAKWILDRECPPPMLFSELVEAELEDCLKPELERLLEMKKKLPEMGLVPRIDKLNKYMEDSMVMVKGWADQMPGSSQTWDCLNQYFWKLLA